MHLAANPSDDPLTSHVSRMLAALGPYEPRPHLAVAVSGGADSMALALMAHDFARTHGGHITALTIDHGLRAESAHEVAQVHAWLSARGIACETLRIDVPREGNLQAAAREARYAALTAWCRAHDVLHLCIGHHSDDQAETLALHRARGDTQDGGSAMAAVFLRHGVRVLRPLLSIRKSALTQFLNHHHQPWIEDPSNTNNAFARVRLRGTLDVDALCKEAVMEGAQRSVREQAQANHAANCVTLYPEGYAVLDLATYRTLESPHATLLLADTLRALSGKPTRPRQHETLRLHEALLQREAQATLAGFTVRSDGTHALFIRELTRMEIMPIISTSGECDYDGRFHVAWHQLPLGHHLAPLGKAGKKQWLQPPKHLPASVTETLPALWHLEEVVAVPHITPTQHAFSIAFAPPKPLAASPFWWLNAGVNK